MSAQKASAPVRFAGLAVAAVLVVLAAAVGIHLLRERGGPRPEAVKPPPDDRVVDLKEQIRHEEYRDGKLRAAIRGDRFFLGPDGLNHLEGAVDVTDYGPAGEILSLITADKIAYDKSAVLFALSGRVRVEAGGVVLEGDSFDYDKDRGLFRTASGGAFSSKRMAGTAAEVSYSEGADEVRLAGGFRAEFAAAGRDGEKAILSGDSFLYLRRERRGRAEGRADFAGSRWRGTARILTFDAAEDEGSFISVAFDGAAAVKGRAFAAEVDRGSPPAPVLPGPGLGSPAPAAVKLAGDPDRGGVAADWIGLSFVPGTSQLSSVQARGKARLSLSLPEASGSIVRASEALLMFRADGELDRWSASGGFRAELDGHADESRVLEGESVAFDASTRVLRASGKPGRPAAAALPRARVEAASIVVGSAATGDLEASGGVKCLLKPGEEGLAAGFFSAAKPIFVSSASLVFRDETKVFSFAGEVQAWQDGEFLLAGELDLFEATGEMRGRGGVVAGMSQAAAGETPVRRIEVGGEDMSSSGAGRVLSFRKKSYVQMPGARLGAEAIDAFLGREGRGVDTLTALTSVVVSKGRYEGRGDRAFYEAGADRITLTGRPVLVDKEGGSSRGDKLTFELGDGKIRVENEGQRRSTTVVKS
jgi:lipopolysaccharide export system protein LptA